MLLKKLDAGNFAMGVKIYHIYNGNYDQATQEFFKREMRRVDEQMEQKNKLD